MITPKIFKLIIAGLLGLIVIILLFTCKGCKQPAPPVIIPPKVIVRQVKDTETIYKAKFDSINAANTNLRKINDVQLNELQNLQNKAKSLVAQLRSKPAGDTAINYGNGTLEDFITNSEDRDTLCNQTINNLQSQVANREQLISAKDSLYSRLRSSFDLTITQQEELISYSKKLSRQLRLKKAGNKIWKGAAAAAIIYGLVKSFN